MAEGIQTAELNFTEHHELMTVRSVPRPCERVPTALSLCESLQQPAAYTAGASTVSLPSADICDCHSCCDCKLASDRVTRAIEEQQLPVSSMLADMQM